MKLLAALTALLTSGILAIATLAGGGGPPTARPGGPSAIAIADIPGPLVGVYVAAAASCPGLPWSVLAAIGHSESRHAQGRADPMTGDVQPQILGPALDDRNGYARVPDSASTDGWAHAQGPMQFLPSTWRSVGRLAPGRPAGATPSPHNAWDAVWSAAALLCGADGRIENLRAAIFTYNHSNRYVDQVLAKAAEYDTAARVATGPAVPLAAGGMTCPVAAPVRHSNDWHAPRSGGRQHQGNDVFAPYGSTLVAIESGVIDRTTDTESGLGGITVWLRGDSGTRWYYAHNARNLAARGARVAVGQPIALLGNTGNARGTSPHVHFEIHPGGGAATNPYPLIAQLCGRAT